MARVTPIPCEFQEGGCHDDGCKIGACTIGIAERRADEARTADRKEKILARVAWLADHRFKVTDGRKATAAEIAKFAATPKVWAAAERMVYDEELLPSVEIDL